MAGGIRSSRLAIAAVLSILLLTFLVSQPILLPLASYYSGSEGSWTNDLVGRSIRGIDSPRSLLHTPASEAVDGLYPNGHLPSGSPNGSAPSAGAVAQLNPDNREEDIYGPLLSERAFGFLTWRRFKRQGKVLGCLLDADSEIAQPRWTRYDQLDGWGWALEQEGGKDYTHADGGWQGVDIGHLVDGTQMQWVHAKNTVHQQTNEDGETISTSYAPTNAEYVNIFWPKLGVIFANRNYGAQYMIDEGLASVNPWLDKDRKPLPIVQLKQWSDVLFLSWQHLTTDEERTNVRWIARRIITNAVTRQIIGKACKMKGEAIAKPKNDPLDRDGPSWRAPKWPGIVFVKGDVEFSALLATPNAKGVVWFLVQHRQALGRRSIKSIRVWHDQASGFGYTPSMLMEIGPE